MTWPVWFWGIVALGFCYLGSVLPLWRFAQPVNYVSFWLVLMGIVGSIILIFIRMPGLGDFPPFMGFIAKRSWRERGWGSGSTRRRSTSTRRT